MIFYLNMVDGIGPQRQGDAGRVREQVASEATAVDLPSDQVDVAARGPRSPSEVGEHQRALPGEAHLPDNPALFRGDGGVDSTEGRWRG